MYVSDEVSGGKPTEKHQLNLPDSGIYDYRKAVLFKTPLIILTII
jgi:hypothetical protein